MAESIVFEKHCGMCKQVKLSTAFVKCRTAKDGLQYNCKACRNAYRLANKSVDLARQKRNYEKNCEIRKAAAIKNRELNPDYLRNYNKKYYQENKERLIAENTARGRSPAYVQKKKEYSAWYDKTFPEKSTAKTRARQAAQIQRLPLWANLDAIALKYKEAATMSKLTGVKHTVDHYYPLRGKTVSGFHVAANLRVIPARENFKKGRKIPQTDRTLL
jgi:hypothetical protein